MKKYTTPELCENKLTILDTMTASPATDTPEDDNHERTAQSVFGYFDA